MNRRHFLRTGAILATSGVTSAQPPCDQPPLPAPIQALKDRKSEATPITLTERQMRFDRARQLMSEQKVSAILMTGGTSLTYFTGLHWGNSERMMCFVLPVKGSGF